MQHLALPSATCAEQQAYHLGVPGFPGSIDQWLIANACSLWINHLGDYLMLRDPSSEYVTCIVKRHCENVSNLLFNSYTLYLVTRLIYVWLNTGNKYLVPYCSSLTKSQNRLVLPAESPRCHQPVHWLQPGGPYTTLDEMEQGAHWISTAHGNIHQVVCADGIMQL